MCQRYLIVFTHANKLTQQNVHYLNWHTKQIKQERLAEMTRVSCSLTKVIVQIQP